MEFIKVVERNVGTAGIGTAVDTRGEFVECCALGIRAWSCDFSAQRAPSNEVHMFVAVE